MSPFLESARVDERSATAGECRERSFQGVYISRLLDRVTSADPSININLRS